MLMYCGAVLLHILCSILCVLCCSDFLGTLSILHESLMRSATAAKSRVSTTFNLHTSALQHSLSLMWPDLDEHRGVARKARLLEALRVRQHRDLLCLLLL